MPRWLDRYGARLADLTISKQQAVLVVLYVSYVWDLVRREYIESRERDYKAHYRQPRHRPEVYVDVQSPYPSSTNDAIFGGPLARGQAPRRFSQCDRRTIGSELASLELGGLLDREFECPIRPMPNWLRAYRAFSTAYALYATVKYTILCSIHYRWLDIDPAYACYVPGRLGLVADEGVAYELPWMAALIFVSHLFWRAMWHVAGPIDAEALLFLCYDRDAVLNKQYEVIELNDPNITPPEVAYRKYLCNKLFYQRRIDSQGRAEYSMRLHRRVEQYDQLDRVMVGLRLMYPYALYSGYASLVALSFCTYFRHDYFDMAYPSCRSFASAAADDADFRWSFGDKFRLLYLLFDLLDGAVFWLDTVLGLTIPFGATSIATHDLSLRFDALRTRCAHLNDKFRSCAFISDLTSGDGCSTLSHPAMKHIEQLQHETDLIFHETVGAFEQVRRVDDYVRRSSTFTFYSWLLFNSSYQASSILNLVPRGGVVTTVNTIGMVVVYSGILVTFLISARPYHRARLLYTELSIAMALCPTIPKTKIAWRWLLEYYKDNTDNTLHLIGKNYTLSNLNVLRCASWLVTCIVILFSLLKH